VGNCRSASEQQGLPEVSQRSITSAASRTLRGVLGHPKASIKPLSRTAFFSRICRMVLLFQLLSCTRDLLGDPWIWNIDKQVISRWQRNFSLQCQRQWLRFPLITYDLTVADYDWGEDGCVVLTLTSQLNAKTLALARDVKDSIWIV
jgi:hypothetical protein